MREKELHALPGGGGAAPPPWAHAASLASTYTPPAAFALAYAALWVHGSPALALPPRMFWPLQWAVTGRDGSVGSICFLWAAHTIAAWAAPAMLEALGIVQAKPPATLVEKFLTMTGLSGLKALFAK